MMTLEGMRIGVLSDLFREGAEFAAGNALVRQQIERLATRGATIVDGLRTGTRSRGLDADTSAQQLRAAAGVRCLPAAPRRVAPVQIAGGVHRDWESTCEAATWTCGSPRR